MSHKPTDQPIECQYLSWRLFRRDGVWYADGRGGRYKLDKYSLGTRDREQAEKNLELLDESKAQELGIAREKSPQSATIQNGWSQYLDYCGRNPVLGGICDGSMKRYRAARDHHQKFCGQHGITYWSEFDKSMLERYANLRGKQCAYRTLYFELTQFKTVNHWLIANGHLASDRNLEYPLTKPDGTDTYCYSRAEVAAMVSRCLAIPKLVWLGRVIIALAHTGLRISELANLRWSDIDLKSQTIRVVDERASHRKRLAGSARTTKGRRSRTIPIHPTLLKLLMKMERTGSHVFPAAHGGKLLPNNVRHALIKHVINPLKAQFPTPDGEIGFEHGRLHSFRHYFCSQSFLGGASEGEIREWLGHADSRMVEHYRHLRSEEAQMKMAKINFLDDGDGAEPSTGVA